MSPSTLMAWVLLVLCSVLTLTRVPAAMRGHNRSSLFAFALISTVLALAIPNIYAAVDAALGGMNLANLASRVMLIGVFTIVGLRVAGAVGSFEAKETITGPLGNRVLALCITATAATFFLADVPTSSMGLNAYADQPWVEAYRFVSRLYPAFIAAALVRGCTRAARCTARIPSARWAAGLFAAGFGLVMTLPVWHGLDFWFPMQPAIDAVTYTALVIVALAPTLSWISRRLDLRRQRNLIPRSKARV
ncbi:hypothetical protein P4U43_14960 [Arthrobacter sp. EH-1B-1]|uniref:Uncharacterized protein n=1 Tax=Arthrobacter vasquezii TaxID=2977629 RepID=A0ABT6D051_9MICC|nr:hypothetical protein [Arthrobacter vasquezii]MDF9279087.1 hypothetical protein [Arthrobacter vasquezii]